MARLMLSAGMLAARAASVAALRRRLPLGSPPPFRAATVISRRIFEKSFPLCTSVLPFFRLICDHRECPDMAPSPSRVDRRFQSLHTLEPACPARHRLLPTPPLCWRLGHEGRAGLRTEVRPQMDVRQVGGTRVPHL